MLFKKTFNCGGSFLCTISLDFVEDFLEIVVGPSRWFKYRMTGAFSGKLSGASSLNGTEILYEAIIEIFITAETVHGRVCVSTDIAFVEHIKRLDKRLRVFDSDEFLQGDLLLRDEHIFGIEFVLQIEIRVE